MKAAWPLIAAACIGCGRRHPNPAPSDHETVPPASSSPAADTPAPVAAGTASEFSAPIAAVRTAHLDVVAGLVVSQAVVRAIAFAGDRLVWTVDALTDVKWAPDAELRVLRAGEGVALMWRGLRGGHSGRTLVQIGPHGEPVGAPWDVGAVFCGTVDALTWIVRDAPGNTKVWAKRWTETDPRPILAVPRDRDPSLVCGDRDVILLGEGSDDVTANRLSFGDAGQSSHPVVVLRDADFADEERDHQPYSVGESIGLVRVGASGGISLRRLDEHAGLGPWRTLHQKLADDDEIVAADGDSSSTFVLFTHADERACDGSDLSPESVRALRVGVDSGDESLLEVAPAQCDRALGPFDLTMVGHSPAIAWLERPAIAAPHAPKASAISFRMLGDANQVGRFERAADVVAFGGCEAGRCLTATLLRPAGSDGMSPEAIRLDHYP